MAEENLEKNENGQKIQPSVDRVTTIYDVRAVIARQRDAVDEIVVVNSIALDNLQNVWKHQCDVAMEAFWGLSTIIDEAVETGKSLDFSLSEYVKRSRQVFESSLAQTHELTDMKMIATKELTQRVGSQTKNHFEMLLRVFENTMK